MVPVTKPSLNASASSRVCSYANTTNHFLGLLITQVYPQLLFFHVIPLDQNQRNPELVRQLFGHRDEIHHNEITGSPQ